MNETERRAQEYVRRAEWEKAIECFDQLLVTNQNNRNGTLPKEKLVSFLIGKSECNFALGRNDFVVQDCRKALKLYIENDVNGSQKDKARRLLIQSLIHNKRFSEAESAIKEWLLKGKVQSDTRKILEQLKSRFQNYGQRNQNMSIHKLEEDLIALEASLESWIIAERPKKNSIKMVSVSNDKEIQKKSGNTINYQQQQQKQQEKNNSNSRNNSDEFNCSYCSLKFHDITSLRSHCLTGSHQTVIMSDEGRDWKFRPPPRGLTADAYLLCEIFQEKGCCRYGAQCVDAHGPEELSEWSERFEYRRMKLQRASEKQLYGKSYTEQLLERWINAPNPEKVMKDKIEGVEESINGTLSTTVSSKNSQRDWTFLLKTNKKIKAVALLQDAHRNHFSLKQISTGDDSKSTSSMGWKPVNEQEWTNGRDSTWENEGTEMLEYKIKVGFKTEIYGTFRQSVVFDFGSDPVLVKHLCVDVVPVTDADRMKEIRKELTLSTSERWDTENSEIVTFTSPVLPMVGTPATAAQDCEKEKQLLQTYPTPRAETFQLTQSTVTEKKLTKNNYRDRMHELLYVEEMARYEQVARYNLTTKLQIANCYLLAPNGMANSTAKYAHNGELFALMSLGKDISEDTSAGRLILNNCSTVYITAAKNPSKAKNQSGQGGIAASGGTKNGKRVVYEALIEDKGKNKIYLRLSSTAVSVLKLKPDSGFYCEVQFQLNRVPYCEWHYAIDKISDYKIIFPDTYLEPNIPWTPQRQWNDIIDSKLNPKQREAILAITTPVATALPPILIIGPFGTGKTYTLAQAIKQLLMQPEARVLVCTHSNSAADLYIKDYLHPYVEAGHEEARPLRIYYQKRWVATVNSVVQKYCLIEMVSGIRTFKIPTLEDVLKHRIVVVTLSISMYLSTLGLKKGHFSHILLDEAAQAMECEAIMPLALANEKTRIVLAGDHMQLSPELFSQFAKERNLHVSLLERLYDHYPANFPCKILLCENYRAHEAIINFTSELFYDQKLISSGKQPRHEKFYPLTFFTTRGEDVQDINSTAFYNNSEVYEVVERVFELKKRWPQSWGKLDDQSIGIMTPYADQVFRIRSELRKRRMGGISVERVLNVQGKQFRAIFLSTVRTRRTCVSATKGEASNKMDYGFLSNSKLLNTAITRAQSLVAVVGDPVALCSIGRCRKVWERFIEICNKNKSLFGITWGLLRSQLDGVELKKTYALNPLAPEFVPRSFQNESYIKLPSLLGSFGQGIVSPRFAGPPFLPSPVPYPVYYYPPPLNHPSSIYQVRPNAPYHMGAPNPWAGFPAPSPTGAPGNSNWNSNVKKKSPEIRKEDVNILSLPQDTKGVMAEIKPVMDIINTQGPQNIIIENYLGANMRSNPMPHHSNISGPLTDQHLQQKQQQQIQQIQQQQPMLRPLPLEKPEHIQFLNNVHFPERHLQRSQTQPIMTPAGTEWQGLLPPNASLADVLESRGLQMDWYRHLLTTAGIEVANRFRDLVVRASRRQDPSPDVTRTVDDIFGDKSLPHFSFMNGFPSKPQIPPLPINDGMRIQENGEIVGNHLGPLNRPVKLTTKPFLLQDLEAAMLLSAGSSGAGAAIHPTQIIQNNLAIEPQQTNRFEPLRDLIIHNPPLPLYRRQSSQTPDGMYSVNNRNIIVNAEDVNVEQFLNNFNVVQVNTKPWEADKMQTEMKIVNREMYVNNMHEIDHGGKPVMPVSNDKINGNEIPAGFTNFQRAMFQPPPRHLARQPAAENAYINDFHLNGREQEIDESVTNRHSNIETTYASVLRAQPVKHQGDEEEKVGDPFGILKDLANSSSSRGNNGLYQYFS
ncbi:hypothetical protein RUM44_002919 [Polyplax serrata]|uniref:C3H1-type domain-containing protein n=1 Tax=Polyplax serrata TaxID=468196 RepID=A0ABR1AX19_POLSC